MTGNDAYAIKKTFGLILSAYGFIRSGGQNTLLFLGGAPFLQK